MKSEIKPRNWNPLKEALFEDEDIYLINKPPGISCLQDRTEKQNVLAILRSKDENLNICHRIDKSTSGLLMVSKNPDSYKHYTQKFEAREIHKLYHAVVEGRVPDEELVFDDALEISGKGKARISKRGKESVTIVSLLKSFDRFSVINCMPLTGRFHQIRIHLSHAGFPLAGDEPYGGRSVFVSRLKKGYQPSRRHEEVAIIERPALHAARLRFQTRTGKDIDVEAPYPDDLLRLRKILQKYDQS